jgi:cholesterol transport system auxiliary component
MKCAKPYHLFTWFRNYLFLLVLIFLTGCIGNSRPPEPIYYYTLGYEKSALSLAPQLPCILRVEHFSASPPFNSQRIIYAHSGLQRNAYAYHQWIAPPGELVSYYLARDLRQCGGFRAVLTPEASLSATHCLYGGVEQFIEKDSTDHWQAAATIHITLISNLDHDPTRRILLQKRYDATAPCNAKNPEALAEAMSEVVGQISQAVIKDVYSRLSATGTLKY